MLMVRCSSPLQDKTRNKISMFTNVTNNDVFSCHDVDSIFKVPEILYDQGLVDVIFKKFNKMGYVNASQNWDTWNKIVNSLHNEGEPINIAMVGKYVTLADSYVSVNHALKHTQASIGKKLQLIGLIQKT